MLPIHDILPQLKEALAQRAEAVLVAAPGAGKTTVVPMALMDEPWARTGRLIVLEPRRIAARTAAERMAAGLHEAAGETVGYRVRMQTRVSARTRVELVTEGVFTRMILDDPGLEGISGVLFDEFHERSLDGDLGLALARDSQQVLRPDLRLLVMSATLDAARVSSLLGEAPVIESVGRQFPVRTVYLGRDPRQRIEEQVGRAVLRALAEEAGSELVFLPGQAEIRRAEAWLQERLRDPAVDLAPLYGAMDAQAQDQAIEPAPPGRRKVVLATSIAETSLTIEGVRVVVDCGLSRVPSFDPASGLTRLKTERVTLASADQRRGRAGRTQPGVCYRLWDEPETRGMVPFGRPEILETDLSRLALDLARWGARDPADLAFMDQPSRVGMQEARGLLQALGALDASGDLTGHGRRMAELPLPPRLAHMLMQGASQGAAPTAARIAVLLTERGLGGVDTDLLHRLEQFARDRSPRARDSRALADRLARTAGGGGEGGADPALLLAAAYPERIARQRGKPGEYRLASGRGAWLEPTDALARSTWLAVGELGGGEARDRVLLAAAIEETTLREAFADRLVTEEVIEADESGRLRVRRRLKLGDLIVEERRVDAPDAGLVARHLLEQAHRAGLASLPWSKASERLRARVGFLRQHAGRDWPDLSDEALSTSIGDWLAPLLAGRTALSQVDPEALDAALKTMIGWARLADLDRLAPERLVTPAGPSHPIDYAAEGGPRVEVRVQELFGLSRHPAVLDGRLPLTLALLSPAHRPIQLTRDLPGFWRGSWGEVRKEMKGRYARHPWPEEPWRAQATTKAKPRGT